MRARWIVPALAASGSVVAVMMTLIVPMLPMFPALLGTSAASASWMATSTLLSGAVATPLLGRAGDLYGRRLMLLVSLGILALGCLVAALAPGFALLLVGRVLQGAGMGAVPLSISILRDVLPPERVPGAIGLVGATLGVGAGAGLVLGGVIVETLPWRAVFWLSGAVAVACLLAVMATVPDAGSPAPGRFDLVGATGMSLILVAFLLVVSKGGDWGWTSGEVLTLTVGAILLSPLWALHQSRTSSPLVDLRTARERPVMLANLAAFFVGFAGFTNFVGTTVIVQLPESTEIGFGKSLAVAGWVLMPTTLAFLAMSPVVGRLTLARGARFPLVLGALFVALGYGLRIVWAEELIQVVLGSLVVGIGSALAFAALPTVVIGSVPVNQTAAATGLNALLRAVGTATASAVFAGVTEAMTVVRGAGSFPAAGAFVVCFAVAGVAALAAAALAAGIPRTGPAGTV